jgi:low affinity Fe/Cu permease
MRLWAASGPFFDWSDTCQPSINTDTTIVAFPMIFLDQNTQTSDTQALHLESDELIRVHRAARNPLLDLEEMSETEIEHVKPSVRALVAQPDTSVLIKQAVRGSVAR